MNFPSIDIQGSILSADLLAKIRSEQATYQQGKDFQPDFTNAKLKDEISLAWQEAKGQWIIFKSKLARLKEGEFGTTETRNFWMLPLLTNLGYNLSFNRQSEELNGKLFPIGYRDTNLDQFPVYIGAYHESLDKRPENKQLRVSPHAMVQEYLNYSEHLYGLVSNGRQLRLLRDASRITRLSYVEFDIEKIMEEDLYSDFVILYRVLHATRMPQKMEAGTDSIIEKYHQDGLAAGSAIRNKLGDAVKLAIKSFANEFINQPNNGALREVLASGNLNVDEYYRHQLRLIYRLLFLFVIEERNLVYADNKTPEAKRFNSIYYNYYSLMRLRKLAKKLLSPDAARYSDLWQGLMSTFSLFEKKEIGQKLGIMALQGDLFGYNAICSDYYDLHQCAISNSVLLSIIQSLTYFENEQGVLLAVNYGGLDVEEFGSVYEGLLELKLEVNKIEGKDAYVFDFDKSNERGKSGSHYTPEELVQPLIKHSLEYLIEDRIKPYQQKKANKESTLQALLQLKIADVACGSGHILLSAARRLALEIARVQTDEEQPNPLAIRKAMKDVVRHCIYGVDKNPLAIELCKIALWLEAYNPGEPLNFLDHHIKCGDAIVGLAHRDELEKGIADEAFKSLPGDDKDIAQSFLRRNKEESKKAGVKGAGQQLTTEAQINANSEEAMAEYKQFNALPETSPEEIERKAKAYNKFINGKGLSFLKAMADTQVAQFFIPKTTANKDSLMTDADYRLTLSGYQSWQDRRVAKATAVAMEQRFFHWFIEFPEVFSEGGFDCILGNPPFLGDRRLKEAYGEEFLEWIRYNFTDGATVDLVVYFFLRINSIIRLNGFQSLISTNTVAQGKAREFGLEKIIANGSILNHAIKGMKWPGLAAVEVSLITIFKGKWIDKFYLNGKLTDQISPFLDAAENTGTPFPLYNNEGKSFQGSIVLGKGFILEPAEANDILLEEISNKQVIMPYLNGDDLNNNPDQKPSRFVINFFDFSEEKASTFEKPFKIILDRVKPERQRWKEDKDGNQIIGEYALRHPLPERWWQHCEKRPALYKASNQVQRVLVSCRVSKYVNQSFIDVGPVFDVATSVVIRSDYWEYSFLQSTFHNHWAWKYGSTMKFDIRYTNRDCIDTFPILNTIDNEVKDKLEFIGEAYHEYRRQLMLGMQLGLTKTYNLFHSNAITATGVNEKDKHVMALQKHLDKTPNTIPFNEAIQGILKLRALHIQMDEVVLEAYGWSDIELRHNFYEVDYLPENDRIRYTIHPDARKEVLKRLLELNHKIHEEELKSGLWEKKTKGKKSKNQDELDDSKEKDIDFGLFQK
jgi:methylase of polypeptide subunit release factors